jgi:hypothetical protein
MDGAPEAGRPELGRHPLTSEITERGLGGDTVDAIRSTHQQICEAMVLRDTTALSRLLAEGYTLTHPTGDEQGKGDWLAEIAGERIRFHAIDSVEAVAALEDGAPVLTVQTLTDATIRGAEAAQRLRVETVFEPVGEQWLAARTVTSPW